MNCSLVQYTSKSQIRLWNHWNARIQYSNMTPNLIHVSHDIFLWNQKTLSSGNLLHDLNHSIEYWINGLSLPWSGTPRWTDKWTEEQYQLAMMAVKGRNFKNMATLVLYESNFCKTKKFSHSFLVHSHGHHEISFILTTTRDNLA